MEPPSRVAIYPGSFDPVTCGHLDIIARGAAVFDRVIVAILGNPSKQALFEPSERIDLIREAVRERGLGNVAAECFDGLLVDFAERRGARVILRGVRAVSDFEYEFQMALMNRRLDPRIETVFLMPAEEYSYVSSRLVREVAALGGDLSGIVPASVDKALRARFDGRSPS